MTDPAALTDEELGVLSDGTPITAFGRHLYRCRHYGWLVGAPSLREQYDACPSCDCGLAEATTRIGRLIAALHASRDEAAQLREALDFYANPESWEAKMIHQAPDNGPNPGSSVWLSSSAIDGGERSRRGMGRWPTPTEADIAGAKAALAEYDRKYGR